MPLFDGQQGLFSVIVVSLFRKEDEGGGRRRKEEAKTATVRKS